MTLTDRAVTSEAPQPPWVEHLRLLKPVLEAAGKASFRAAAFVFLPAVAAQALGISMIGYLLLRAEEFTQAELQTVVIVGALLTVLGLVAIPSSYVQAGKATTEPKLRRGATEQLLAIVNAEQGLQPDEGSSQNRNRSPGDSL